VAKRVASASPPVLGVRVNLPSRIALSPANKAATRIALEHVRERRERVVAAWTAKHGRPPTRTQLDRALEVEQLRERTALVEREVREEERAASADAIEHALAEDRRRRGRVGGKKRARQSDEALLAEFDALCEEYAGDEETARSKLIKRHKSKYSRPDAAARRIDAALVTRKKITP